MKITRRDFIKTLADVAKGIGIVTVASKIPVPEPAPVEVEGEELVAEFAEHAMVSFGDSLTAYVPDTHIGDYLDAEDWMRMRKSQHPETWGP